MNCLDFVFGIFPSKSVFQIPKKKVTDNSLGGVMIVPIVSDCCTLSSFAAIAISCQLFVGLLKKIQKNNNKRKFHTLPANVPKLRLQVFQVKFIGPRIVS